jgi:hypothetical protein
MWRGRPIYRAFCISQKPHLLGSPVKEPSLKVPFMESLAERCPTTRARLRSSIKVPGIRAPPRTMFYSDGKGPPWREMPASGDFPNISSRVPSEGAPPKAPSMEPLQREMLHTQKLQVCCILIILTTPQDKSP